METIIDVVVSILRKGDGCLSHYPNLEGEIAKRGIKKGTIAKALNVCNKSFYNKMNGKVPFTWPEVCTIRKRFFPDLDSEYLFRLGQ